MRCSHEQTIYRDTRLLDNSTSDLQMQQRRDRSKITLHQGEVLTAGVFQVEGTGIQPCTHTSRIASAGTRIAKEG
jgi:hypothetical protein